MLSALSSLLTEAFFVALFLCGAIPLVAVAVEFASPLVKPAIRFASPFAETGWHFVWGRK